MKNNTKVTVIGSTGNKYTVSKSKDGKMGCSCPRWINTSPRKDCKHIKAALAGKFEVKSEVKKEKTMAKKVTKSLSGEIKQAVNAVLSIVTKKPSAGWTREKLFSTLEEKFGKRTILSAIVILRSGKDRKLDKKRGAYIPMKATA